jgi:RES domain-containing protein
LTILWRISRYDNLTGIGGEKADARWHTAAPGKRIVYLSEHPAVALIETLVNLSGTTQAFPRHFQLLRIEADPSIKIATLDDKLPDDWQDHQELTRRYGDEWLKKGKAALVRVPSVPSPQSFSFLLNPLHPDAQKVRVVESTWLPYDQRLFRPGK